MLAQAATALTLTLARAAKADADYWRGVPVHIRRRCRLQSPQRAVCEDSATIVWFDGTPPATGRWSDRLHARGRRLFITPTAITVTIEL